MEDDQFFHNISPATIKKIKQQKGQKRECTHAEHSHDPESLLLTERQDQKESNHFVSVLSSFANYQNDAEEDIERMERDLGLLTPD